MTPKTANPQSTTTIPSDLVQKKQNIASLITHIARQDNHLWQALNSLQNQANGIVNQTTDWTSWNPSVRCYITSNDTIVPPTDIEGLNAYYMVSGQICLIELWTYSITIPATTEKIFLDLPIDLGETVIKTCAAWLICPPILTQGNGICSVECQKQSATLIINPNFAGQLCRFMMGGALGIIQTPGQITGVDTAPR